MIKILCLFLIIKAISTKRLSIASIIHCVGQYCAIHIHYIDFFKGEPFNRWSHDWVFLFLSFFPSVPNLLSQCSLVMNNLTLPDLLQCLTCFFQYNWSKFYFHFACFILFHYKQINVDWKNCETHYRGEG